MKILIASDWFLPVTNGVVTSILNLEKELIAKGHDVRILTLSDSHKTYQEGNRYFVGSFNAGYVYPEARISPMRWSHIIIDMIDWKPDIIHTQCEMSTFMFAKKIQKETGAKIVHTYHTVYEDYVHYAHMGYETGHKVVGGLSKWVCNKLDAVVAPTDKTKNLLIDYGVDVPIYVVPTGINLQQFYEPSTEEELDAIREKYNIKKTDKVLGYIGRIAQEKNIDQLLDYTQALEDDYVVLIVGNGPYSKEIEEHASKCTKQRIIFTGRVENTKIQHYYHVSSVFINASTSETQGLTYIEALASGTPIICKKDDALNGVLEQGVNGYSFDNEQEFVDGVHQAFDDYMNYNRLCHNAKKSTYKYSTKVFGDSMEKVYMEVLNED